MPNMPRFYDANIAITAQGQYHSTPPSLTDKESIPLQVDSAGNLLVNVAVGAPGGGGGPATIADGANVTQGAIADAAVTSDVNGTLSAKLRGLVKILADAWDSANHRIKVDGSGVTQPVSGTVSVGNFPGTQPVSGTVAVSNFPATQPVSGTVTASAGANLNTSLLALEAGGNLASIKADVDKIPSQGQALSAASMPVVLPATQITTLTPPAAITGFALETGGNLASIKADVDKIPSQGQALSAASMPVVLPATQIATLTPPTSVGVNNFPATQPVSAASLPLPANASQETGGNLATIALQTRNDAQIIDILNAILGQLKLLNLNLASAMPSAHVDSDTWVMDALPTLQ